MPRDPHRRRDHDGEDGGRARSAATRRPLVLCDTAAAMMMDGAADEDEGAKMPMNSAAKWAPAVAHCSLGGRGVRVAAAVAGQD